MTFTLLYSPSHFTTTVKPKLCLKSRESEIIEPIFCFFLECRIEVLFPLPASLGSLIKNSPRGKKKALTHDAIGNICGI